MPHAIDFDHFAISVDDPFMWLHMTVSKARERTGRCTQKMLCLFRGLFTKRFINIRVEDMSEAFDCGVSLIRQHGCSSYTGNVPTNRIQSDLRKRVEMRWQALYPFRSDKAVGNPNYR